jgi:uncharacterized protein YjiS (DUF1127 family)
MVSSIIRFIQHWNRYGRVLQQLSRLSNRELADIGVARSDINRIASGQLRQYAVKRLPPFAFFDRVPGHAEGCALSLRDKKCSI